MLLKFTWISQEETLEPMDPYECRIGENTGFQPGPWVFANATLVWRCRNQWMHTNVAWAKTWVLALV